jgi:serine/threonine-protein kinase HipA
MGALEFRPALGPRQRASERLDLARLADLADQILQARAKLRVNLKHDGADALGAIIRVGTSAGGARAKAVIAWNPHTHEVRSGQVPAPPGFEHWLLKFDTAAPTALGDPAGFGRIEFAYHLMAAAAGIDMSPCRLLEEGGRAHFMTRRFDRTAAGGKLHMQSLCALGHYDFNAPGEYSYEQALALLQQLRLPHPDLQRLYRRMVFNVLARNQDDHTRNIALLMDPAGNWRLAPAFDVIWSFNAHGRWTNQHQMRVNGKTDDFTRADLLAVAPPFALKSARHIIAEVRAAIARWPAFAAQAGVPRSQARAIAQTHRLVL